MRMAQRAADPQPVVASPPVSPTRVSPPPRGGGETRVGDTGGEATTGCGSAAR